MTEQAKTSARALDAFGRRVGASAQAHPTVARRALAAAFKAEHLRTRLLPNKAMLPSGQLMQRLAVAGVADAMGGNNTVITSIFMPCEIFLAMGLKPMVAEALADFVTGARAEEGFAQAAEQAGVSETYCSYHKVLMGAAEAGVLARPRLVANCSVACDANNVTFRWVAEKLGCGHSYIDVPYEYSEDACVYVADQLRELAQAAQDAYGRKLDDARLRLCVERSQKTLAAARDALPARAGRYMQEDLALTMQEALVMHLGLGTPEALRAVNMQARDFSTAAPYGAPSLVWMHAIPYFSPSLGSIFNRTAQAQIVASEMCFDQVQFEPWAHTATEPYEAMAERLIKNSFNGPATRRIEQLRRIAQATSADGVVVFCHWGCKETMGASQLARTQLEAAGFPVLVLDGDGCRRANNMEGQASTRMSAFIEMLAARKGGKGKAAAVPGAEAQADEASKSTPPVPADPAGEAQHARP